MTAILPVVLAGGAGTRLWPVSRETMPKHLARIIGEESLLQLTAKRVMAHAPADHLITVAARHQDLLIRRQLDAIDPALTRHRLLEPVGRNTAAAIALAALHARKIFGGDAVLWICPSDHLIRDEQALAEAVKHALPVAADGNLLTFGIQPTRPETGYGYIRAGAPAGADLPVFGWSVSSRSPTFRRRRRCSPRVVISGTAACFCSEPIVSLKSSAPTSRESWRRPTRRSRPLAKPKTVAFSHRSICTKKSLRCRSTRRDGTGDKDCGGALRSRLDGSRLLACDLGDLGKGCER